jgi:uncharacterized protein (TIGR02466 family)
MFPTPLGVEFNINVSNNERSFLLDAEYHLHEKYNMIVSCNKYIINDVPILKAAIQQHLDEYSKVALATTEKLIITQSWCSKHENSKEYVFPHAHQNSVISGVYYVAADDAAEGLTFYRNEKINGDIIAWPTSTNLVSTYNWDWETISIKQGMLLLFPSKMMHSVSGTLEKTNNIRCALAFNTWFKDPIGSENDFSRLKI